MLRIFTPVKIQSLRPGLNPQTWVPEASMLTTRPPKPFPLEVRLGTMLKCICHSAHIFRCSYSSRATRRLLVDNWCSSSELCNPIHYFGACRNLSIPPDVKMSSENRLRYSSGIIVLKKTFPQQTLDALLTNAPWRLKASNCSTQRCVFHHATYKDIRMRQI